MQSQRIRNILLTICGLAIGASSAAAQTTVTVFQTNRGWVCDQVNYPCAVYGQTGVVQANNGAAPLNNIFSGSGLTPDDVGQTFNAGIYRNWFQFPIPKLAGPLVSAVLTLPEPNRWNAQDLTYTIYGLPGQPATFTDVKGVAYGSVTTHASDFGKIVYLTFNAAGKAAIEGAQGGMLYIGGIDSGETMGGYHGDFSGTGATDAPPNPNVDRRTPLTLTVDNPAPTATVNATCTGAPAGLGSFVFEHLDDFSTIQTTLTANVPPSFGPVFAGLKIVRDRITYDNATKLLSIRKFLMDPGAGYPTPPTFDIAGNTVSYVTVPVDTVKISCRPRPVVSLSGIAADGVPFFGNPAGVPTTYSFGYTTDAAPRVRDVVELLAGMSNQWVAAPGYATVSFMNVSAAIAGVPMIVTNTPVVTLDGSASAGGPLTYSWGSGSYGLAFIDPSAAKTTVYVGAGYGDYQATLTVSNLALGESASTTITIRYQSQ